MKITKNNIGDIYRAKLGNDELLQLRGYTKVKTLFCDSSGLGADDEMALTCWQLEKEVNELLEENGNLLHAFITNAGQFQVYLTLYKKTGKSTIEKIALNTYKIPTPEGYKIRYYNTDIVEKKNGRLILNSGGFYTKTTKERINLEIAPQWFIYQKAGKWFINNRSTGKKIPFTNGITI